MNFANCKAYEWIEEQELPSIHSKGYVLRHKKTNAHIGLIANDDPNKVFYVGFRTPSIDSTGAAHIVEHTVLCGSKRFPAKDPFVELVGLAQYILECCDLSGQDDLSGRQHE